MKPTQLTQTDRTARTFASVPSNFRKGAKLTWHQWRRRRTVLGLMAGVSGRVLDYGCGYGDIAHAISESNPVAGCDVEAERVAFAAHEYGPIPFTQCEVDRAPFEDGAFDVVVSVAVIHFVPDPERYLAEIKRLLKPEGKLVFVWANQQVIRNFFRRLLGRQKEDPPMWVPTKAEMTSAITKGGFKIIRSTYFYDPPLKEWKNCGDWLIGMVEQVCSLLHIQCTAGYYGCLVERVETRADLKSPSEATVPTVRENRLATKSGIPTDGE